MKRLTAILVAGVFVLAPLSASAMEMMSDSNMKDVTGQAGVSIAIDDVVLYQESVADTTYWDTDGSDYDNSTTGLENGEYGVQIKYSDNAKKLITVDAIYNETTDGLGGKYTASELASKGFNDLNGDAMATSDMEAAGLGFDQTGASALSIDVGRADVISQGKSYNTTIDPDTTNADLNVGGVIIGLPTVEITQYHNQDRRSISLKANDVDGNEIDETNTAVVNSNKSFIDIEQGGTSRMAILGGTVEIAPH